MCESLVSLVILLHSLSLYGSLCLSVPLRLSSLFTYTKYFFAHLSLVKKRIDRTQSRLDKVPNQELLLEAAHALRVEKDRQKELESQLEQQMQDIQRCETVFFFFC